MGIFKAFTNAKKVVEDAKKDVKRPKAKVSNLDAKRQAKQQGGKK